jgi:hypothetical protein
MVWGASSLILHVGSANPIRGLEAVIEPLPWFSIAAEDSKSLDSVGQSQPGAVTSLSRARMGHPVSLMLSRHLYPAEDGHLDAIVRFDRELHEVPDGRLELTLTDAAGRRVSEASVDPIPGSQLFLSYDLPDVLGGDGGELRIRWLSGRRVLGEASASFRIEAPAGSSRTGRIGIQVPNEVGATVRSAPMTVGVPFPRGVLESTDHLRLVDESGREVPLQVKQTANWSRFGSVKWALCDFTVDLVGTPRRLHLEYGPQVSRARRAGIEVTSGPDGGLPRVNAGRVRIDESGIALDVSGRGNFRTMLAPEALAGAFVEHSDGTKYVDWGHHWMASPGRRYAMPGRTNFEVEEIGPEKVTLRAEGWYEEEGTGERFCRFVNRYVIHRDSPVVRIFHTWIFTGDGNRDRIRNMGWRMPLSDMQPAGFLSNFGEGARWLEGYYLRQHDNGEYALFEYQEPNRGRRVPDDVVPARPIKQIDTGKRAAGVMAARGDGGRLYVGVQDFWQNFPASLMLEEDAMTFYQWPKYGRYPENPIDQKERRGDVWRLWFAHEGDVLAFNLPMEMTTQPLYEDQGGPEPHFLHATPESVNAQGIAKTAEMWLYLTSDREDPAQAARVLEGLSNETLRAVVDPRWMAGSGAFYEIGAVDREKYPREEHIYGEAVRNPMRQVERMGIYGKWIYGDVLRTADMNDVTADNLYRNFRKAHWGWPYSWIPFVRSGETDLLRFAQAATRMMSDTAFCHYVSDEMREFFAGLPELRRYFNDGPIHREIGWHNRNAIPWAGFRGPTTRCYVDQADYLLHAWYVSGYDRARDVALAWAGQTKIEQPGKSGRGPITIAQNDRWPANMQKQYTEMYEATFDPWFLAAAHAIADMNVWRYREQSWEGHFWLAGYQTFQRYSGRPDHEEFILFNARHWGDWHHQGWASTPPTGLPSAILAHRLTGDDYYLRRAAGVMDLALWSIYDRDEPWYFRGFYTQERTNRHKNFLSWFQLWSPEIIGMYNRAGGRPEHPIPPAFDQRLTSAARIALYKEPARELALRLTMQSPNWSGQAADERPRGRFSITGPNGRIMMDGDRGGRMTIPAEAPPGVYVVDVGNATLRLPISEPGTREVLLPGADGRVESGQDFVQHWFRVPEGVDSFWIEFDNTPFGNAAVRQIIVWNADGEEAWAHRERAIDYDRNRRVIRADVRVPAGQAGRLWRVTLPGLRVMPFRLGPQIPRILAHDPTRWFDPEASAERLGQGRLGDALGQPHDRNPAYARQPGRPAARF